MNPEYQQQLDDLAKELVNIDRFSEVKRVAELATVFALFPALPQAQIHYFPDREPAA